MRLVPAAGRLFEGTKQMRDGSNWDLNVGIGGCVSPQPIAPKRTAQAASRLPVRRLVADHHFDQYLLTRPIVGNDYGQANPKFPGSSPNAANTALLTACCWLRR
jgi:hypothetical protein